MPHQCKNPDCRHTPISPRAASCPHCGEPHPAEEIVERVERVSNEMVEGVSNEMVEIPAGEFRMGSEDGNDDEKPRHLVRISRPFLLGRYPVVQALYGAVAGGDPSHFEGASRPVENVSWYDAVRFCNQLSGREGLRPCYTLGERTEDEYGYETTEVSCDWEADGYRLPTEAEWEYAAKAGTELRYSGSDDLYEVAWHRGNSGKETHPVGGKKANAWGLHDMSGNVWEWCWDWEADYASGTATDPSGPPSGSSRVDRGGSWNDVAGRARVAFRGGIFPGLRYDRFGFRLSRSAP